MNNYRATARCNSARNLPINFFTKGHKNLKYYLWAEGTVK